MRISDGNVTKPMSVLVVAHQEQYVLFDVGRLKKPSTMSVDRIFELINGYFDTLPRNRQQAIFDTYVKIKEVLDKVYMDAKRQALLSNLVKELYTQIQLDEVSYYNNHKGRIQIPTAIKDRYEELEISERKSGNDVYRKRTYLRKEYLELIDTAVALKAMIPIWGEYLSKITGEGIGSTHKEVRCLELLKNTPILKSDVIRRLKEYIEITIPGSKEIMSSILHGMGTSDLPDWLLSIAIVRKICVVEISSIEDNANLVSVIYSSVMNTIRGMDRKLSGAGGRIRSKDKPKGNEEANENKDLMSIYKLKEKISVGDLIDGDRYSMEYLDIARRLLGEEPDPQTAQACAQSIEILRTKTYRPNNDQEKIIRWIISPVVSPWTVDNISYISLLHLVAACQITLIQLKMYDIAVLLTAEEMYDEHDVAVGGIESRSRVSKEYAARFAHTHPYYHTKGGKNPEITNIAHKGIDELTKAFSRCDWIIMGPVNHAELVRTDPNQRYVVATSLKDQLCDMLDFITRKTYDVLEKERQDAGI